MSSHIRIGLLTPEYPGEGCTQGGIGSYVRTLALALADLGHEAAVFLTTRARDYTASDDGVSLLGVDRFRPINSPFPSTLEMYRFRLRLGELARELRLDILEAPEWGGLTAGLNLPVPIVVRLHTPSAVVRQINRQSWSVLRTLWHAPTEWRERRAIRSADAVTSISRATTERTCLSLRLRRHEIECIPNPVDRSFYNVSWKPPLEPVVLFAGRCEWRKGPDRLARAISAIREACPQARFRFVGADTRTAPGGASMLRFLRTLITPADLDRVEFAPQIQQSSMPALFLDASVCVFPSRWEGFGLTVAEAMACGAPVVVSDSPAFLEMISPGVSGLVVAGDDTAALAAAVTSVLRNRGHAADLGRNARAAAMRFHPKTVAEATAALYRAAIARFALPRPRLGAFRP